MAWKFGRQENRNPTPAKFVFWVRIYTTVAVAFLAWMPTAEFIPHKFQDISTSIIGLTVTIANIILPYFGVQVKADEEVPVEKVGSMENGAKDDDVKPNGDKD